MSEPTDICPGCREIAEAAGWRTRAISAEREIRLLRRALTKIRAAIDLPLPSEQTGPDWERCVRIPVSRMMKLDAVIASVLGDPPVTGEPKPALHARAGIPTGPGTIAAELTDPAKHGKTLVRKTDGTYGTVGRSRQRAPKVSDLDDRREPEPA